MKYQYLKLSQIVILSLISIYQENFIIYIGTLVVSLLTNQKHWLSIIISILLITTTLLKSLQAWKFIIIIFIAMIGFITNKITERQPLNIRYIIPVLLLSISLISINQNFWIRNAHLFVFFYFLLLTYYFKQSKMKLSLYVSILLFFVEGSVFSIQYFYKWKEMEEAEGLVSQNKQWWYFLCFPISIQCACLILQELKGVKNIVGFDGVENQQEGSNSLKQNLINKNQQIEIQMQDLQKISQKRKSQPSQMDPIEQQRSSQRQQVDVQEYFKNIELKTDKQKSHQQHAKKQYFQKKQKQQQSLVQTKEQQQQSQSLNLILIIPFLLQNTGILQIPLYFYILSIHFNKTSPYTFFVIILTTFIIIFLQPTSNIQSSNDWVLQQNILLRFSIVLLVNKNIHILNQVTQITKKIWSKSSFVFVLAFLFWFSLKTVNIFHIVLTIVLLLFITIQNQKNQYSYRHKNWIYLLAGFNSFLFSREMYHIITHYGIYDEKANEGKLVQNILDLIGISYSYQSQQSFFNLIPYIISILIAFQYLTYQSTIYNSVRERPILPIYQRTINQLIKLLTIVYYKLIPWISYVFIYFVLLSLQFSCTSLLLLIWISICLCVQVQKKNCLPTYKLMYRLWSILERLFAVQIILRYAFEFLNFPMFYNFFHQLPFFNVVQKYKEFLGLAIRQADYVYFKAITKFQLMVGLDFACIFICFLVIQYYMYLIAYFQLQQQQSQLSSQPIAEPEALPQLRFRQKQIIKQIYTKFIDFKLTMYLKKFTLILKYIAKIFLSIYYPIIGIFCCFYPSLITLVYLIICIRFYINKNSQSYDKFIKQNLILKVKQMFLLWKEDEEAAVNDRLDEKQRQIKQQQTKQYKKMQREQQEVRQNTNNDDSSSLKLRLYKTAKKIYFSIISGKKSIRFNELINFQSLRIYVLIISSISIVLNYSSRVFQLKQTFYMLDMEMGNQTNNPTLNLDQVDGNQDMLLRIRWLLFVGGVSIDSNIRMVYLLFIMISTIFQVKCTRFLLKLYDLSANRMEQQLKMRQKSRVPSKTSQPCINKDNSYFYDNKNTNRELYENFLQQDDRKYEQLKREIEENWDLHDADYNLQLEKNIQSLKYQHKEKVDLEHQNMHSMRIESQNIPVNSFRKRKDSFNYANITSFLPPKNQHQNPNANNPLFDMDQNQPSLLQLKITKNELKKFIQMKVSLLQGITKFIQRCFVMVLVFLSIVQNRHPFGIIYLICSILLTFIGAYSILSLSRVIAILIVLEYLLIICNYSNYNIINTEHITPAFKQAFQSGTSFDFVNQALGINISGQWSEYLQFGDTSSQIIMMILSYVILFSYQLYFNLLNFSWQRILDSLVKKISLTRIQKRIYQYSNLLYTYFLIYSPLCITICSLGIYLLDFTITNLFLTCVSILFLFKSVLVEQYSGSRQFWRLYFYILQFFIVIFILIYDILSIPMYQKYCIKILCSSQQFHTKIYKAGLLFILQIGIDLTKSSYFIIALDNLKISLVQQTIFNKLSIAYKQNDRKINKKFRQLDAQKGLEQHLLQVQQFLQKYKTKPQATYENKRQILPNSDSWMDLLIETLPSFVDSTLVLTSKQAKQFIKAQNEYWIKYSNMAQQQISIISDKYLNQFGQQQTYQQLMFKIKEIKQKIQYLYQTQEHQNTKYLTKNFSQQPPSLEQSHRSQSNFNIRKSFSQNRLLYEPSQYCKQRLEEVRESLVTIGDKSELEKKNIQKQEKKKLIFLLVLESIVSNWHYFTYFLLILEHLFNMGLLTMPFPILAFCYGLVYSYQAPKNIWRVYFLLILLPIGFKFAIAIQLIPNLSEDLIHLLIGDNKDSILIQYLIIMFVLVECLILKIIGLYDQSVTQVQSMKLALIRNIINNDNKTQIQHLSFLLKQSLSIPEKTVQYIFSRTQQKQGYSYTTLMTSLQLISLIYVFFFYDQMAIRKQVTIYQMISYNQFTAGMVILTLIQLSFILLERFINITDFKQYSYKWQINLILKYVILLLNILYVQLLILLFFPFNSNNFTQNTYIHIYFIINSMIFLVSSLQIKYGIDQKSKGFMDRYTWYNGFIYMGFRAVPFLFQFKVFSDWTFTKTALRLFDWIKLEEIFGRMYIAKCNSIFLSTKIIGSKIEWWKKLLMGVPLLFAIILLIFGPLILFSSLNPLASKNSISAGYLQLCLKVNRTNQYVFYTNSHITDIVMLTPNQKQKQILQSYDIQQDTVQIVNLQQYSDQYWEISQGSYIKLLEQPKQSLYQIVIRMKFQRNQTGSTPTYTLGNYEIPYGEIDMFKKTLQGEEKFKLPNFLNDFLRLDNNNGIHQLGEERLTLKFYAQQAKKNNQKKYWIIENGLKIKIASDKYTKAIFGYSVMSFYISIILVIANYFRFLFQGSANSIILNDIPFADPVLSLCNGVYKARFYGDTETQQKLFWLIIDLLRSPDEIKSLTGNYLQARIETKRLQQDKINDQNPINQDSNQKQSYQMTVLQKKNNILLNKKNN